MEWKKQQHGILFSLVCRLECQAGVWRKSSTVNGQQSKGSLLISSVCLDINYHEEKIGPHAACISLCSRSVDLAICRINGQQPTQATKRRNRRVKPVVMNFSNFHLLLFGFLGLILEILESMLQKRCGA